MPEYQLAARKQADRLDARAAAFSARVLHDIQRALNYVLVVVLFASALFFAGISTKLTAPKLRIALLSIGSAIFLVTAIWIARSPVSVSV
jgi:hypothetical protein